MKGDGSGDGRATVAALGNTPPCLPDKGQLARDRRQQGHLPSPAASTGHTHIWPASERHLSHQATQQAMHHLTKKGIRQPTIT